MAIAIFQHTGAAPKKDDLYVNTHEMRLAHCKRRLLAWSRCINRYLDNHQALIRGVMLTYREADMWAPEQITSFIRRVKRHCGDSLWAYAWVLEMQERQVEHYHICFVFSPDTVFPRPVSEWFKSERKAAAKWAENNLKSKDLDEWNAWDFNKYWRSRDFEKNDPRYGECPTTKEPHFDKLGWWSYGYTGINVKFDEGARPSAAYLFDYASKADQKIGLPRDARLSGSRIYVNVDATDYFEYRLASQPGYVRRSVKQHQEALLKLQSKIQVAAPLGALLPQLWEHSSQDWRTVDGTPYTPGVSVPAAAAAHFEPRDLYTGWRWSRCGYWEVDPWLRDKKGLTVRDSRGRWRRSHRPTKKFIGTGGYDLDWHEYGVHIDSEWRYLGLEGMVTKNQGVDRSYLED